MLKTIFLGSSEFVLPTLEVLKEYTNLSLIITGLDKILTKREKGVYIPEPKQFAQKHHIPFLQPKSLKDADFLNTIKSINADLGIVVSYGKLLPIDLFNLPKYGIFNLHGSLLPSYKGASPIQESLLQGDNETGITLQKINEHFDEGNVLGIIKTPIDSNEVYPQLRQRLSLLAASLLEKHLIYYNDKKVFPPLEEQDGVSSTCSKIKKENGMIDLYKDTAQYIFNKYRAYYTWPQIQLSIKNIPCKIIDMSIENLDIGKPGEILEASKQRLIIKAKEFSINIKELQPQNKKRMDYLSFINGYNIQKGDFI